MDAMVHEAAITPDSNQLEEEDNIPIGPFNKAGTCEENSQSKHDMEKTQETITSCVETQREPLTTPILSEKESTPEDPSSLLSSQSMVTNNSGLEVGESSNVGSIAREKKLMAMIKQQKLTIRKLENIAKKQQSNGKQQTASESTSSTDSDWSLLCPSLASASRKRLAQSALASLLLPLQRLQGFQSLHMRQAFNVWKEGGPQPTVEQALTKAARLKALLSRSSTLGNKLKEENDMLRLNAKKRNEDLLAQIARLKEDKLSLQSAIRAASLSSDFADDYEIQLEKAQRLAISQHRNKDTEVNDSRDPGDDRTARLENNIAALQQKLADEKRLHMESVRQSELKNNEMLIKLHEMEEMMRDYEEKMKKIEDEKRVVVGNCKSMTSSYENQISDLKQELKIVMSCKDQQVKPNLNEQSQLKELVENHGRTQHALTEKSIECDVLHKQLIETKEQLGLIENKMSMFRQIQSELAESEDTVKALRRALHVASQSSASNDMDKSVAHLLPPKISHGAQHQRASGEMSGISETELERLYHAIDGKIKQMIEAMSAEFIAKEMELIAKVNKNNENLTMMAKCMGKVELLSVMVAHLTSSLETVDKNVVHCDASRAKLEQLVSKFQNMAHQNRSAMIELYRKSRVALFDVHYCTEYTGQLLEVEAALRQESFAAVKQEVIASLSELLPDSNREEGSLRSEALVFTSPKVMGR